MILFPSNRIVRLAPRGGMLADGRPCKLIQVGCGRVKVEYLDDCGHVATSWFDAEHVLLREYERLTNGINFGSRAGAGRSARSAPSPRGEDDAKLTAFFGDDRTPCA